MTLNQRELAGFLCILRHGSINSAAQSLGITQPALSRSVKRLEAQLGAPLFVRHSQGMEPTRFGTILREYAEQVEFETDRVVEEIRLIAGAATGLVRVGAVPSAAVTLVPPALGRALARSPLIKVRVVEGLSEQLISAVKTGELDFALVGQPHEPDDGAIVATLLGEEEVCVAARADHPLFSAGEVSVSALSGYPWILPERGNVNRHAFYQMFARAGVKSPPETMVSNSAQALKAALLSADYITILTRSLFATEEAKGLIRPLPLSVGVWTRRLSIVRRTRGQMLPAARLLMREVTACAGEFAGGTPAARSI